MSISPANQDIPYDIWFHIQQFTCPITLRSLNRKYCKKNKKKAREKYPSHFLNFDYLNAIHIKISYETLCLYFSKSYQCAGYTKKKQRCNNRCKNGKYCHLHGKTVPKHSRLIYYNSSIYRFLTHDVPAYE